MPDHADITKAIRGLFDGPVGVGVTDPRAPQPKLMRGEVVVGARAVPARLLEFAAGRAGARMAMAELGLPPQAVPASATRDPAWPKDLVGSITHTATLCATVISREARAIGLDMEPDRPLDEDIVSTVCSRSELSRITDRDRRSAATLIFTAKEAAYKAQFPLSRVVFDFDTFRVAVDTQNNSFTATFVRAVAPFAVGDTLPGRFAEVAGHLVSGVAIGQFDREGA